MQEDERIVYPPCKYCGAEHGMGIEHVESGKITPIDICYDCLWKKDNRTSHLGLPI
jgi:hypothetical protein